VRRLDIGILSYNAPESLDKAITAIRETARTDWRLFAVDNASPNQAVRDVIMEHHHAEPRIWPIFLPKNTMYAGGVNEILRLAQTEYIAFSDHDTIVHTEGWDEIMASYLDRFHEIGLIGAAGFGAYPINRGAYTEVQWITGCWWMVTRMVPAKIGGFDETLGHQEECDYALRLRMAGWKVAQAPIEISHEAKSTNSPESIERISAGVINFVNKWVKHFCGERYDYYHPQVLRWEDWSPNALFMEEYWKSKTLHGFGALNADPAVVDFDGREYDLIRVPRLKGFYRGRVI
jgi:GT2 family glycosyltransferase